MTEQERQAFEQMRVALREIMLEKRWLPAYKGWFIPDNGVMGSVRNALEKAENLKF